MWRRGTRMGDRPSRFGLVALARSRADTHRRPARGRADAALGRGRPPHPDRQTFTANLLTQIGLIDETSVKTNRAQTTGWAPKGDLPVYHAPFGAWQNQTFNAALRHA